jgi:hypothetical protein
MGHKNINYLSEQIEEVSFTVTTTDKGYVFIFLQNFKISHVNLHLSITNTVNYVIEQNKADQLTQ